MSDEKPKPVDDLKQGLNLLFRAAKGAVDKIPTDKIEGAVKDGAKEVGKAFETVASELDKAFTKVTGSRRPPPPPPHAQQPPAATAAEARRGARRRKRSRRTTTTRTRRSRPKGPRVG